MPVSLQPTATPHTHLWAPEKHQAPTRNQPAPWAPLRSPPRNRGILRVTSWAPLLPSNQCPTAGGGGVTGRFRGDGGVADPASLLRAKPDTTANSPPCHRRQGDAQSLPPWVAEPGQLRGSAPSPGAHWGVHPPGRAPEPRRGRPAHRALASRTHSDPAGVPEPRVRTEHQAGGSPRALPGASPKQTQCFYLLISFWFGSSRLAVLRGYS